MEDLEKIAKGIKRHRDLETTLQIPNSAIGRSKVKLKDKENVLWLTMNEDQGSSQAIKDFVGNAIAFFEGNPNTLIEDGRSVYKNTKLGEVLTKYFEGKHKYVAPGGTLSIEIFNRASYTPEAEGDVIDLKVNLANDKKTYQYKSLLHLLTEVNKLEDDIADLKTREEEERNTENLAQLEKEIAAKEKELEEKKSKAQSFIRKNAALRLQPILDAAQEEIKRSNIFKGTLVIDGGPGTGKTTSLIQRIKFLTAISIEEYYVLTQEQKNLLFDEKRNWLFFSPSELLRLYLKNNMAEEGLRAGDEKVKVWAEHKRELCMRYKLFNSETKRPFLSLNKKGDYFNSDAKSVQKIHGDFDTYFFQEQLSKLSKVRETELDNFSWKKFGKSIQKYLQQERKLNTWSAWFMLYININETFGEEAKALVKKYNELIQNISTQYLAKIKADPELQKRVYNHLDSIKKAGAEDEEEDNEEEESEDFEELNTQTQEDNDLILSRKLKTLCRKHALRLYDVNTKFTKSDRGFNELVPGIKGNAKYEELGQLAYFIKHFKRVLSGPVPNVLGEIAKTYKQFRRARIAEFLTKEGKGFLSEILKDKNKRIHPDEQAFLLTKINIAVKDLFVASRPTFAESNHAFINAFRDHSKAVIGIDEASDFSAIDILCMHSLTHPLLSSVTLSGDLMQRMTIEGIRQWSDLSKIIKDIDLRSLLVSYRQSPTLLEVAKKIYQKATGLETNYTTYTERDIHEPPPLSFFSTDEDDKIEWIAKRIIEVHNAYGNMMPSIAIFLSHDHDEFTTKLNNHDLLADVGIKVVLCRDGQILGDRNSVRVFPIEYIKGLEFEAVFFHNIDVMDKNMAEDDLLIRYLYVGLSRATFYLGITGNVGLPKALKEINSLIKSGEWKI